MRYGRRTAEVQAFIDSIRMLTEDEWMSSVSDAYRSYADIDVALDSAQMIGDGAANASSDLWDQKRVAEIDARNAASSLEWEKDVKWGLAVASGRAAGSIVVLDAVSIDKLAAAFVLFRHTAAVLPVNWTS